MFCDRMMLLLIPNIPVAVLCNKEKSDLISQILLKYLKGFSCNNNGYFSQ